MVHLVLDHARLEAGCLDEAGFSLLVDRSYAHVDGALDVDRDAGYREAALVEHLLVLAGPLDLRVRERDHRRVGAHAIDEEALRDAELGRGEAHAVGVAHDARHPAHLPAERVVEAVDRRRARLQDRVAQAADEGHRRDAPRLGLWIECRRVLLRLLRDHLRRTLLGLGAVPFPLFRHSQPSLTPGGRGSATPLLRVHVDREARVRVLAAGRHLLDRGADRRDRGGSVL